MESIVSAITEIVPQITYDIIARFVPGIMVIFSWAIVVWSTLGCELRDKLLAYSPSGWSILLFLLVAYILSIVLYGIWRWSVDTFVRDEHKPQEPDKEPLFSIKADLSSGLIKGRLSDNFRQAFLDNWVSLSTNVTITPEKARRRWRINDIGMGQTYIVERTHGKLNVYDKTYPSESLMYDAIRVKSPVVGARLVKLRAEARQAQVLIVGWVIACILNPFLSVIIKLNPSLSVTMREDWAQRVGLEVILIAGIVGVDRFRRRIKGKYIISIKNHWRILQFDQEPWFVLPSDDQNDQSESLVDRLKKRIFSTQ